MKPNHKTKLPQPEEPASRAEVNHLRERIIAILEKDPKKSARVLSYWIHHKHGKNPKAA